MRVKSFSYHLIYLVQLVHSVHFLSKTEHFIITNINKIADFAKFIFSPFYGFCQLKIAMQKAKRKMAIYIRNIHSQVIYDKNKQVPTIDLYNHPRSLQAARRLSLSPERSDI